MTAYFPEGVWYDIYQLTPVTKSGKTSINLNAPRDTIPVRTAFCNARHPCMRHDPLSLQSPLYVQYMCPSPCLPVACADCQFLSDLLLSSCHLYSLHCHLHSVILSPSFCPPVTFTLSSCQFLSDLLLSSCHLYSLHCHLHSVILSPSFCPPVTFTLSSCHLHFVLLSPSLCHPITFTLSTVTRARRFTTEEEASFQCKHQKTPQQLPGQLILHSVLPLTTLAQPRVTCMSTTVFLSSQHSEGKTHTMHCRGLPLSTCTTRHLTRYADLVGCSTGVLPWETPLGPSWSSCIERCPLFRGSFVHRSMRLGLQAVSSLERCPLLRVS